MRLVVERSIMSGKELLDQLLTEDLSGVTGGVWP